MLYKDVKQTKKRLVNFPSHTKELNTTNVLQLQTMEFHGVVLLVVDGEIVRHLAQVMKMILKIQ